MAKTFDTNCGSLTVMIVSRITSGISHFFRVTTVTCGKVIFSTEIARASLMYRLDITTLNQFLRFVFVSSFKMLVATNFRGLSGENSCSHS